MKLLVLQMKSIEKNEVPLDEADDKNDKKSNENNVAEEIKEGPVEMEWDVNDDNNQELDDNGQIKNILILRFFILFIFYLPFIGVSQDPLSDTIKKLDSLETIKKNKTLITLVLILHH